MFCSNQILKVSGRLSTNRDELECALEFALKYSGEAKKMRQSEIDRGCKLLYQITKDGKYCIGWGIENIPEGWSEYPFRFDIDNVSKIIRRYLECFPIERGIEYGYYEKGFIMQCIDESISAEKDGIINPFYGIVYFEPYTCFYS